MLHRKGDFGKAEAQESLAVIRGKFAFPEDGNIESVSTVLEDVLFGLNAYIGADRYVLSRSLYPTEDGGDKLDYARFVVRPKSKYVLDVADMRRTFEIPAGKDFFENFITEMAVWFDNYEYFNMLQHNVNVLNEAVQQIIEENEIPFSVSFTYGDTIVDASDNHVVVGLGADVIENLQILPLFDELLEDRRESYKTMFVETLKQCVKPYDIVKVKSQVTRDLNIYSRRDISKLLRGFVSRKIEYVRVGTGYVDTGDVFAVIQKVAVTDAEAKELGKDVLVLNNKEASSKEKERGLNKVAVSYVISPFNKADGTPTQLDLKKLVG